MLSIVQAQMRAARRERLRQGSPTSFAQAAGDYAHQGHRLDLNDERTISHRETRYLPEARHWDGHMWVLGEAPKTPQRRAATIVEAPKDRTHLDGFIKTRVHNIVDAGGSAAELVVVMGKRAGRVELHRTPKKRDGRTDEDVIAAYRAAQEEARWSKFRP